MKIFIFVTAFISLITQIFTVCPSNAPYSYNSNCYPQCPWAPPDITYLNPSDNTCVTACAGPTLFADDSTKSCVTTCPNSPIKTYYDHNLQKCVEICPSNPSLFALQSNRSCIAECPSPFWADDSTRQCVDSCPTQKFYQILNTRRICTSKCYPSYYANQSKVCVTALNCPSTPVKYYGDDLSGLCVKSCPQNASTYAQQSTRLCVHDCTLGTFADPTSLKCVSKCPSLPIYYGSNTTRKCHLMCIQGQFGYSVNLQCYKVCPSGFGDYKSRMCVQTCPQSNGTYADPLTKLCISKCSPGYFADNQTRTCTSSVNCTGNLVGNPLTLQCIDGQNCPIGYFVDYNLFMCVKRCSNGQYANLDTRVCSSNCPWNPPLNITFKDPVSRKCVNQCPFNPRTFSDNITQSCVSVCGVGTYGTTSNFDCVQTCPDGFFGDNLTNLCVSNCTTNTSDILYFYITNSSCLSSCPLTTYADNTTLTCVKVCPNNMFSQQSPRSCVQKCQNSFYGDNFTRSCVSKCPAITKQFADDSTNLCVSTCPLDPDYFGQDLNDGNRKCVSNCTLSDVFADPLTRLCIPACNTTKGYFGDRPSRRCVIKCPTGYGNPVTKQCTNVCPQSPIQLFGDNLTYTCVQKCPNNTYGDRTLDVCVKATDCPSGTYGDDSTNMCVSKCPFLKLTYGDPVTKKCVKSCQFSYYTDNTTRTCTQTCNVSANLYKDPSTRQCVIGCPSVPDLYNDPATMKCQSECTSISYSYKFAYQGTRKCVSMCPASPVYFADQQVKKCVTKCANGTYKFVNNSYRGCLLSCPQQIFNATVNLTLYADNTTWTCVSVCPLGYYAFKHPSNNTIRKCVRMCEIVAGVYYFADDLTRSCVTQCPMRTQKTYGDRLAFKCVKTCTRKQYRDETTKQCTYSCPKTPIPFFADNSTWNCSRKCPQGTYAQSINNTCVKQCPTNYFGYNKTCLSSCPTNTTVYQDNTTWFCIPKCTQQPDYYSDPQNQKCVKNCTPGTFADNFTRTCLAALKCSNNTVADPLTYRCITQCSKVPMYFKTNTTNLCGPVCTSGSFSYNETNQCVAACPAPYFGVNTTANFYCIQYCPTGQFKYIDTNTSFRICLNVCPTKYFGYQPTMQCMTSCPSGYFGNTSNFLCVTDCTPLFAQDSNNMCVSTCSNGTTADGNIFRCVQKCKYGQFMQNNVCVPSCLNLSLFADNLTRKCLPSCPSDPFTFADVFTNKCLFQCSPNYYGHFANRTCLLACPTNFYKQLNLRICINPCLQGQFADPQTQTCVTGCSSSSYSFADPSTKMCVQKCPVSPDLYGDSNKCIEHCPSGLFAQNFTRTCVPICPNVSSFYLNESFADDLTGRCLQKCSALSYSFKNITHNVCLNLCPPPFYSSQILQSCVTRCPNTTFARNDTRQCVSQCPDLSWGDLFTQTCMDGCYYNNQFSDNSTNMCVDQCPSQPDLYGQTTTKQCVFKCSATLYSHPLLRLCLPNCDAPYYADPSTGLCVLVCPTHALEYADDHLRKCVSSCSNYTNGSGQLITQYADRTTKQCVLQCPQSPQILYGVNQTNTCQSKCPNGTFGDNDTRLCLDFCIFESPKFRWMDRLNRMCVNDCPDGYFSDNTTKYCDLTCSTGTFADNSTNKCVFTCPLTPKSFASYDANGNPVCVYTCPNGTFAEQLTRTCVSKCPIQPFYNFHSFQKNACVRQCLYPYFGQLATQNCVQTCKDGFYGNLTSKKCQACRTQCVTCSAYLQCLTCQLGFFLFQFECVTACPTYPILYFSLQSSATCFKVCPPPYFGLQATKKCQLSCPVSYYPNLLNRRCTTCPTGCLTCDSYGCLTCYSGYTYLQESKRCNQFCNLTHIYYFKDDCYKQCPDGSFLTKDLVHCDPCNQQCATCDVAAGNCTRCAEKFFYQGLCVDKCPTSYFVNEDMACISCAVIPQRCVLEPLTYTIKPFTENYQSKAYVVFSRTVDMTLNQFIAYVQIYRNGVAIKPSQFTAKVYNSTTYVITFLSSMNQMPLNIQRPQFITPDLPQQKQTEQSNTQQKKNQNQLNYKINYFQQDNQQKAHVIFSSSIANLSTGQFLNLVEIRKNDKKIQQNQLIIKRFNQTTFQLVIMQQIKPLMSLNQDTYSIGFKPGTIKDMYGNILTVNKLEVTVKQKSVVTASVAKTTNQVTSSVEAVTWLILFFLFLYYLKGGYPALLTLQVAQIIYMHIFLYADPMPYIQLKFLQAMKNFHFLFFGKIAGPQIHDKQYDVFMEDVSFLANSSPIIFVWVIILVIYGLFLLLSNKKIIQNKDIRRFAKKVKKYRTRYQLIHDGFWITFLYAMFFAIYGFKQLSFDSQKKLGSFFFGIVVLIIYTVFTVFMVKLGSQYKKLKKQQIPKKYMFIMPQQSSFPMQLPVRYIRKLFLCFALVMPSFQGQIIIMMMTNFVFLSYYYCYMPSSSKLTNYINIFIELGYIVIEGLFYGYFKLENKGIQEQYGFSVTLIIVEVIMLFITFMWFLYKLLQVVKQSETWGYIYMKLTQNTDPQYLREQQRKRDLQFDFGSLQNRSVFDQKDDISAKNLNLKTQSRFNNKVIFDKQIANLYSNKPKLTPIKSNKKKEKSKEKNQKSKKSAPSSSNSNSQQLEQLSLSQQNSTGQKALINQVQKEVSQEIIYERQKIPVMKTRLQKIKTPLQNKRGTNLKIQNQSQNSYNVEQLTIKESDIQVINNNSSKKETKGIWDDIQFDDNQI